MKIPASGAATTNRLPTRMFPVGLWRSLCAAFCVLLTALGVVAEAQEPYSMWEDYAQRFITENGRVLDTGNGDVSHTEGQGWAMLLAEAFNDRARFHALWTWTDQHLDVLDNGLLAWRYQPEQTPPVQDLNNASDGDLLIAWALHRAAAKWREPEYEQRSRELREAIRQHLVHEYAGYTVLLPAQQGFEHDSHVTLNLSYWVTPALQAFAEIEPNGPWRDLLRDGDRLLSVARFGDHGLPPDWLTLNANGDVQLADNWQPRFGFEAIRIPLYKVWAGHTKGVSLDAIRTYWQPPWDGDGAPPAWVALSSDEAAEYPLSRGGQAIRSLLLGRPGSMPHHLCPHDDYYSSSLLILSWLAAFLPDLVVPPGASIRSSKAP